jgi:Zn-dependent protease with chaperone function
MDFFEAQERAKKRTSRLVALFILAVLGTIAAGYAATVFLLGFANGASAYDDYAYSTSGYMGWWQPPILGWVALGTVVIVGIASLSKWLSLRSGGSAVAQMLGGRRVDPRTTDLKERQLLNVVEEMAIASGTPLPAVYLLDEEKAINAFAAGLTTSDAVVAVTRGTLDRLSRDELQGVIGHEFSHILNGDMRLNLKLTSVVFGILAIALLGQTLLRSLRFANLAGGSRRGRRGGGGGVMAMIAIGFALMIIGYIGYFFGRLIQAAVSRQREYLADAAAVQFTRLPSGIAGALKKIGGLALGSRLATPAAAQINHAFFAQNFRSHFGGLFATHPPLPERIRAIEPQFDGQFIEPPTEVDVTRESFRTAGFGPVQAERMRREPPPDGRITVTPATIARSVGLPTPAHVEHARQLLESLPAELTAAAHDRARVFALVYALLLDGDAAVREKQREAVAARDASSAAGLAPLEPAALALPARARLPLLQVALGTLRDLDTGALDRFITVLDELVHADARVTPFEYAMQKMVSHHLQLARQPSGAGDQIFSFTAVAEDLGVVLSVLAHESADDDIGAARAYAAGLAQLRMLESPPSLLPRAHCSLERLDPALARLQRASLPIKKRLIDAAAHVIGADGTIRETEAELLRAICAALDCPMPPLV